MIGVVLVDDHPVVRRGLRDTLSAARRPHHLGGAFCQRRRSRDQFLRIDRLRKVQLKPRAQRLGAILGARIRGQCSNRDVSQACIRQLTEPGHELKAVHVRHRDIGDDHVRPPPFHSIACLYCSTLAVAGAAAAPTLIILDVHLPGKSDIGLQLLPSRVAPVL